MGYMFLIHMLAVSLVKTGCTTTFLDPCADGTCRPAETSTPAQS